MTHDTSTMFGTELRRRRLQAGLTLTGLSRLVHYSKSHLSKVETGAKPASADLARQCDTVLCADGALTALVPPGSGQPGGRADVAVTQRDEADEVWIMTLDAHGGVTFGTVGRRAALAGGVASIAAAWAPAHPMIQSPEGRSRARAVQPALAAYRVIFDHLRQLGQWASPVLLLPQFVAHVHGLRVLAARVGEADRGRVIVMAARFAEYAGWLAQEAGDDARALWWTDRAVDLAAAGGNLDMTAYAYVRRGLIAYYQHDAAGTVALARTAQAATGDRRIRGLAAQREAQGHALAGDYGACMRAIGAARARLAAAQTSPEPVIGTSNVVDIGAMAAGWCLFDLGRPAQAAMMLEAELGRIPAHALRSRARYGARLALAHAASGEPEAACAAAMPVLDVAGQIESATIRSDLQQLARTLNRFHGLATIRDTRLRLTESLALAAHQP